MALVFFDLDGTLLKGLSAEKRFFLFLLRGGTLRLRQLTASLIFILRWSRPLGGAVWGKNKAYLTGLKLSKIQPLAAEFTARAVRLHLRPAVKRRLENHLAQGDTVILLTGTPDFIARPIAGQLGVTHIAATVCAARDGHFISAPPNIHPVGPLKYQIAARICRDFNTTLAECVAYADSSSDIDLLASVFRPVAVHPDSKLRQVARRRGWEIIEDTISGLRKHPTFRR